SGNSSSSEGSGGRQQKSKVRRDGSDARLSVHRRREGNRKRSDRRAKGSRSEKHLSTHTYVPPCCISDCLLHASSFDYRVFLFSAFEQAKYVKRWNAHQINRRASIQTAGR